MNIILILCRAVVLIVVVAFLIAIGIIIGRMRLK